MVRFLCFSGFHFGTRCSACLFSGLSDPGLSLQLCKPFAFKAKAAHFTSKADVTSVGRASWSVPNWNVGQRLIPIRLRQAHSGRNLSPHLTPAEC